MLAMPSLMETHDESTEATFSRLYANSLARHIVTGDKRIARVFEQWKGTKTLTSPLEKNAELMRTLIAETPWVLDAVNEKESRARIALLFDATRANKLRQRHALDPLGMRTAAKDGSRYRFADGNRIT